MKFLLYEGRHGQRILAEHEPLAWEALKKEMQEDNRCSFEEAVRDFGPECLYGSFDYRDEAYLSMDDGGTISTLWLTDVDRGGLLSG